MKGMAWEQEMLRRGFLANGLCLPTFAHKEQHVSVYLRAVEEVFGEMVGWLREAGGDEMQLGAKLNGPIAGAPAIQKRLVR